MTLLKKCPRCNKKINKEVDDLNRMFFCPKCQVNVANRNYQEMKGGNDMVTKKVEVKAKQAKAVKAVKVPKVETTKVEETAVETPKPKVEGVSKLREANALKVDEFMSTLGADDAEKRKICSRLYGLVAARQKA